MDITILAGIAIFLFSVIIGLTFYLKQTKEVKDANGPRAAGNRAREAAGPGGRRAQIARNRGVRLRANVAHQELDDDDEGVDNEEEINDVEIDGKMGAKKRAKLEAKAEKKAARKVEEQIRADKKKKAEQAEDERRKADEREKAEEKRLEEEQRKAKEDQEKREYEEYLKMKEAFSVEEEGFEEGEEGDSQNLLQEFVNYIKTNKVVVIEDLAALFKLKTQAAIDRIKDLQKDDILTGVVDDRGKFIYVSPEEMEAVAKFIRQRGRVSIAELAENSNVLINLTPNTTSVVAR
ncbi:DDRGK domain-containing protein 1 [Diabrotica virgifera virgifera]|uniref:DDRGK domain-containing protein 1 n=1 Tax=Diabrotica virgifera virgifera TaxID=50390 RepID=A0A6P7F4T7_DIAVI|nr:DDRGK domain-containing protein 1 [Diabrotica virgifera virgifera]